MTLKTNSAQIIYEPSIDVYKLEVGISFKNKAHTMFLDMIKQNIPASDRDYNPATKIWMFQPKHYDFISLLAKATFHPVYEYTKQQYEDSVRGSAANATISPSEYRNRYNKIITEIAGDYGLNPTHYLRDEDTYSEAAKIYKRVALILHPDRHPNDVRVAEYMSKVNECWASIKLDYQKKEQVV